MEARFAYLHTLLDGLEVDAVHDLAHYGTCLKRQLYHLPMDTE